MSIKVMSLVWDKSAHKDTSLLLLLAIADFADDDGYAWPSIETLQKKIRVDSPRTVHYNLKKLVDSGELSIKKTKGGRSNTHGFQIDLSALNGAKAIAGFKKEKTLQLDAETLQLDVQNPAIAFAPEPSLTVIEPPIAADAAKVSIANATEPKSIHQPTRTDNMALDPLAHALAWKQKQAGKESETIIRAWNLPQHLEDLSIEFTRLTGAMPKVGRRSDKGIYAADASDWISNGYTVQDMQDAYQRCNGKFPITHLGALFRNVQENKRHAQPKTDDDSADMVYIPGGGRVRAQ